MSNLPDGEFRDFRDEMFRFSQSSKYGYVYTWFTPDDVEIHSKRLSKVLIDVDTCRSYVMRYGEPFYLEHQYMRHNVDIRKLKE